MASVIEACTSLNEENSKSIIPKDIKQNGIYVCLVIFTLFFEITYPKIQVMTITEYTSAIIANYCRSWEKDFKAFHLI